MFMEGLQRILYITLRAPVLFELRTCGLRFVAPHILGVGGLGGRVYGSGGIGFRLFGLMTEEGLRFRV